MPLISKSDLVYEYKWTARSSDDNPRVTGVPDSPLLNRGEGYEMLDFINKVAKDSNWTSKAPALKMERLIKKHVPKEMHKRSEIRTWLVTHWKEYE